jgi:hypothetical protein
LEIGVWMEIKRREYEMITEEEEEEEEETNL